MTFFLKIWSPYFQKETCQRGRALFRAGRVRRLAAEGEEWARARVEGEVPQTVTVLSDGATASATCTCKRFAGGSYCKHIWATLLDLQQHPVESAHEQVVPKLPKARKRSGESRQIDVGQDHWSQSSQWLSPPREAWRGAVALPGARQVLYWVRGDLSRQHRCVVVQVMQRMRSPVGWGKPKAFVFNEESLGGLEDAGDYELGVFFKGIGQVSIVEASGAGSRQGVYLVPQGAERLVLSKMVATGRCWAKTQITAGLVDDAATLTWADGPPWTLWLVGRLESECLVVELRLRREGEEQPVGAVELALGGPCGVVIENHRVGAMEDGGAGRWLDQAGSGSRSAAGGRSLRVPLSDVEAFLDQLLRLPDLPRLDLPGSVLGPARQIRPVPHMIVSDAAAGGAEGSEAGQDSRRVLTAKVWFVYGRQPVRAGKPGRFVLLDGPVEEGSEELVGGDGGQGGGDLESAADRGLWISEGLSQSEDSGDEVDSLEGVARQDAGVVATDVEPGADQNKERVALRDLDYERGQLSQLAELGFRSGAMNQNDEGFALPGREAPGAIRALLDEGWTITYDDQPVHRPAEIRYHVTSGIDWFELRGQVEFTTPAGQDVLTLPQILAAVKSGQTMIRLADGSHGLLPTEWLARQSMLATVGRVQGDHLRFGSSQSILLDLLLREEAVVDTDEKFQTIREKIEQFSGIRGVEASGTFNGELRPYQKEGLGWLEFLRWLGLGGVLADDMGLGKTVQVLAMLESRCMGRGEGGAGGASTVDAGQGERLPSLVVAPRSLVFNWVDEAGRFAPNLRVMAYTGADRAGLRDSLADHDVVVTSYGLLRRDVATLRKQAFDYLVLDEAQMIKNPASQSAKAARLLKSNHRLALTGTPVENHLGDLWSIFEFLIPGMLGSHGRFAKLVRSASKRSRRLLGSATVGGAGASGASQDKEKGVKAAGAGAVAGQRDPRLSAITNALRPFVLRRTKQQVLPFLPEKTEQTLMCQMPPKQRETYNELLNHYRGTLSNQWGQQTGGAFGAKAMAVLEALLRLRQVACHPGLVDPERVQELDGKIPVLLNRLEEIIDEGHKALVFSQFTSMLAIVRQRLDEQGTAYEYLDGQTRDRQERIRRFQSEADCPLFLISLKAGGLGLNLTAADYVFILDPWWNPAAEAQAIDRTHRIGQTRHVFAYRLICQDTIEQRVAQLQARKRELAQAIIAGHEMPLEQLTRQDLEFLLS